jgi:hypothetical protein
MKNPEQYLGKRKRDKYFEGWYYKITNRSGAFAVIPGITKNSDNPHAFIQFNFDGRKSIYRRFSVDKFSQINENGDIAVDKNRFGMRGIYIQDEALSADLHFKDRIRWPAGILYPNSMGPFAYLPFMECRHHVLLLHGNAEGKINGNTVENLPVYIEKDSGSSFPSSYIWMQSNASRVHDFSITASIAKIPYLGFTFTGFIIAVYINGAIFRFTTYSGAVIDTISIEKNHLTIKLHNGVYKMRIVAEIQKGAYLKAPTEGRMDNRIEEALSAHIEMSLFEGRELLFRTSSEAGGLELYNHKELLM